MAQYIDKAILAAEIERRVKALHSTLNEKESAVKYELKDLLSFLDSIETKSKIESERLFDEEFDKFSFDFLNPFESGASIRQFAKNFFELGRKTIK